jgi:hypothetical protein
MDPLNPSNNVARSVSPEVYFGDGIREDKTKKRQGKTRLQDKSERVSHPAWEGQVGGEKSWFLGLSP